MPYFWTWYYTITPWTWMMELTIFAVLYVYGELNWPPLNVSLLNTDLLSSTFLEGSICWAVVFVHYRNILHFSLNLEKWYILLDWLEILDRNLSELAQFWIGWKTDPIQPLIGLDFEALSVWIWCQIRKAMPIGSVTGFSKTRLFRTDEHPWYNLYSKGTNSLCCS